MHVRFVQGTDCGRKLEVGADPQSYSDGPDGYLCGALALTGVINRSFAAYYGITLVYTVLVEVLFLTAVASGDILNAFSFFLVAVFLPISFTGSGSGII